MRVDICRPDMDRQVVEHILPDAAFVGIGTCHYFNSIVRRRANCISILVIAR